ncbi:hypothetical protein [Actinokineospora diospyrosa]|uniref:Uncharacterized protein n=1 Tax=Actinokineospora diospyrosa TaxID=103728 RepID=A0ABT1IDK7_9PSEU|nr:hypothetical protein [Actinokineospora diospyrosa]MCP2270712.1 hypothetical protein [Actinokineospora diospyrosa]
MSKVARDCGETGSEGYPVAVSEPPRSLQLRWADLDVAAQASRGRDRLQAARGRWGEILSGLFGSGDWMRSGGQLPDKAGDGLAELLGLSQSSSQPEPCPPLIPERDSHDDSRNTASRPQREPSGHD